MAIDDEVPDLLAGDAVRLRQILLNLLSNAVKFTERGTIRVIAFGRPRRGAAIASCCARRFPTPESEYPAEAQKRLFQSFSQAETSTTRRYGGTGLGLAISKRLVELMGGEIGFESVLGEGSTFWFTAKLNLGTEALPAKSQPNDEGRRARRHGGTILVVEDNRINQKVLSHQLINLGYADRSG